MGPGKFDPRHSRELLKHMDKQNEVLIKSHRLMKNELHTLQVQEEMFMCKLYEVMSVHGHTKQNEDNSHNTAGAEKSNNEVSAAHEEQ